MGFGLAGRNSPHLRLSPRGFDVSKVRTTWGLTLGPLSFAIGSSELLAFLLGSITLISGLQKSTGRLAIIY